MNNFTLSETLTLLGFEDLGNEIQLSDWHV
jgi:hypothetical protein